MHERMVEANIKTASRLKQLGVQIETIILGTGLSEEEIKQASEQTLMFHGCS